MSISSYNYYLKDGSLYKILGSNLRPVDISDVLKDNDKGSLLLSDKYFFYVGIENVAVSGKKLHAVASNYLNILFPAEMIKDFTIFQHSACTIILVINQELIDIIKNYPELFSSFKKISTPFLEACIKYNDFIFSDGTKLYKKSDNMISIYQDNDTDFITDKDVFETMESVKYSLHLSGVVKKSFTSIPILAPALIIGICYILFIIGNVSKIYSYDRINNYYNEYLNKIYTSLNIDTSKDPYGVLVQKSKTAGGSTASERVLNIIDNLGKVDIDGIAFKSISIRDNDVRVEGSAETFAKVEELKNKMEAVINKTVNIDDSKKTNDSISFVMKYEKNH